MTSATPRPGRAREARPGPGNHIIVVFGATGDLARRKLPPGLFHLAVPPAAFEPTVTMLGTTGLARGSRVIIEKPFGTDLAAARVLNAARARPPPRPLPLALARHGAGVCLDERPVNLMPA
jgi:Glucose-6-phosphate dehydrogenase, NAD binding domain